MSITSTLGLYIKRASQMVAKPDFNDAIVEIPNHLPNNKYFRLLKGVISNDRVIRTSERIIEYPFLYMHLNLRKNAKILEIGSCRSRVAVELASLGYKVTACDIKHYKYKHPNLNSIQGDIRFLNLPSNSYDGIISISSIEHSGLGAYGEKRDKNGDKQAMEKIYMLLKPKGKLILTLPYGKNEVNDYERVYNQESLRKLLSKFNVKHIEYFKGLRRDFWIPVEEHELRSISSVSEGFGQGVACVAAVKNL